MKPIIPIFLPAVKYVKAIAQQNPLSLHALCGLAGLSCKVESNFVQPTISLKFAQELALLSTPDKKYEIRAPLDFDKQSDYLFAVGVLAYGFNDYASRETICHKNYFKIPQPRGRKPTGKAMSAKLRKSKSRAIVLRHNSDVR